MKIDKYHKHELLDRLHVVREMFDAHISDHPAVSLLDQKKLLKVIILLDQLYQDAGAIRHGKK